MQADQYRCQRQLVSEYYNLGRYHLKDHHQPNPKHRCRTRPSIRDCVGNGYTKTNNENGGLWKQSEFRTALTLTLTTNKRTRHANITRSRIRCSSATYLFFTCHCVFLLFLTISDVFKYLLRHDIKRDVCCSKPVWTSPKADLKRTYKPLILMSKGYYCLPILRKYSLIL